eukprot:TRINITY_DN6644_c1_g2_i1.p1 TRINITY_DN6644_c1_g2~~TRINITY_DN6644_c1_g2_i1.p1  ORF type:complete len:64 (+),score=15.25 TRINITY_DN6644_c1_g2_i1:120-311(+)
MPRKLPGKAAKESREEKQKRIAENKKMQQQLWTVAIPTLVGVLILVFIIFFLKASSTPAKPEL